MTIQIVDIVLTIILVLFTLADIPLALDKIKGNTWSERIKSWSYGYFPSMSFIIGLVAAHWTLPVPFHVPFLVTGLVMLGSILVIQAIRYGTAKPFPGWAVSILFFYGILIGFLLWP